MIVITFVVLTFTRPLLTSIGIDKKTINHSCEYILNLMPGIWFIGYYDSLRNFLSAQERLYGPLLCQCITILLHICLSTFFIEVLEWPWQSVCWSMNITTFTTLVLMVIYIRRWKPIKSWIPWNKEMWVKWGEYLDTVLPIAGCFYTESLIFEINAVFAALFHIPL